MNKKKEMNFNINNFLLATTNILDKRDIETNNVSEFHSLRVAYISLKIGEKLALEPKKMFDLCAYSLFHNYINKENAKLLGIDYMSDILSSVINFVHTLDEEFDFSSEKISNRKSIITYLNSSAKIEKYADLLLDISSTIDFWMDCQSSNMMQQYIYSSLYDFTEVLTFEEVLKRTKMFGSLYQPVDTFLERCLKMITFYNFDEKDKWTFLIAASMIDFGKLSIPKSILEKKSKLTSDEYEIVKSNVYFNKNALRSIYGFEDISKWATKHQEQLDGDGYPSRFNASDLSLKDRLMSILHKYNALLSKKEYRAAYSEKESVNILELMNKNYQLDKAIVDDLINVLV